jgi:protein TonB
VAEAPVEPAPPPPPAPAAPSAGELDLFQAAMRRAVQAAAIDPEAAEMAHEFGVVRVEFTYRDGVASDIQVIGSSGFPLLDDAARQAVRNANYPPQPPDFAGRTDVVVVDVIFRPTAANVDSD